MAEEETKLEAGPSPGTPRKRWRRRLLVGGVALTGLAVAAYALRGALVHPLLVRAGARAAARAGYELHVEEVSTHWRGRVELAGVVLLGGEGRALRRVEVERAELRLAPRRFLEGPLLGLGRVVAEGVTLEISAGGGQGPADGARGPIEVPALPEVRVDDARVIIGWPGGGLEAHGVSARGEGERFSLRAGRLDLEGPGPDERTLDEVAAEGEFAGELLWLREVSLAGGQNRLRLREVVLPLGVDLDAFLGGLEGTFELHAEDLPWLLHGSRPPGSPGRRAEELPEHQLALSGNVREGRVELGAGRLDVAGGELQLAHARVEMLAAPGASGRAVHAEIEALFPDLEPLGRLITRAPWSGSARASLEVGGRLPLPVGKARVAGSDVTIAGARLGDLDVEIEADRSEISVVRGSARSPAGWLQAGGSMRIEDRTLHGVRVALELDAPRALGPWVPVDGDLWAFAELEGPLRRPTGEIALSAVDVSAGMAEIDRLEVFARAQDGRLEVERFELDSPEGSSRMRLVVDGIARGLPIEIGIEEWRLEKGELGLALDRPSRLVIAADGALELDSLSLSGERGTLRLSGRRDALGSIEVRTSGQASGLESPRLSGRYGIEWEAELAGGRARIERAELTEAGATRASLAGSFPFDPAAPRLGLDGELELEGTLELPSAARVPLPGASGRSIVGGWRARFALGGRADALTGTLSLASEALELENAEGAPILPAPMAFELDLALDRQLVLREAFVTLPGRVDLRLEGSLDRSVDLVRLAEEGARDWLDAPLDARARFEVEELAWLSDVLPSVRRIGGRAEADLRARGTLGSPLLEGSCTVENGELRLMADVPPLDALAAEIRFEGRRAAIEVAAEMGAAPIHVTGELDASGAEPTLALTVRGKNVLLARTPVVRLRADLDATLTGPMDALVVGGRAHVLNSRITKDLDLLSKIASLPRGGSRVDLAGGAGLQLFHLREPPLSDLRFDVAIDTLEPLELASNIAHGELSLDLHLSGTGAVPIPRGRIFLDDFRVKLPAGVVPFETGLVTFDEQNPFVPTLEMRGETRLLGYDVTMRVTGPYDQPEIVLSSSPPLPPDDLLLLVLTGQLPQSALGQSGAGATRSITLYLARNLVSRGAESDGEESLLERIEVVRGRNVSKTGTVTTEASFRLTADRDDRRAWYLVAEQDVYEDVNLGFRVVFRFE